MPKLLTEIGAKFLELARDTSKTVLPIVKILSMEIFAAGNEMIENQFELSNGVIIVAPFAGKSRALSRNVVLHECGWNGECGSVPFGGIPIKIKVPLQLLSYVLRKWLVDDPN